MSYGFNERPSKKNSAKLRPPDVPTQAGHIHMHTQAESKHEPPCAQALTSAPAHTHVHMYTHEHTHRPRERKDYLVSQIQSITLKDTDDTDDLAVWHGP